VDSRLWFELASPTEFFLNPKTMLFWMGKLGFRLLFWVCVFCGLRLLLWSEAVDRAECSRVTGGCGGRRLQVENRLLQVYESILRVEFMELSRIYLDSWVWQLCVIVIVRLKMWSFKLWKFWYLLVIKNKIY